MPITRIRGMTFRTEIVRKVKNWWGFQEGKKGMAGGTPTRLMGLSGSPVILLLFLVLIADIGKAEEWSGEGDCIQPLGMETYNIAAHQLSASSSYNEENTGPQFSRIRQEKNGGAWCPRPGIQRGVKEYLEIDLVREFRITQTETQGRYGGGMGVEYAENFQIEYWRDALAQWVPYKDYLGRTILEGNINTYTENKQELNPPIIASKIRFIPYSQHIRTVCMRVEVYGCNFTDGVLHYEAPQGYYKANPELDFRDGAYDGSEDESGTLRSGLGLLTDMQFGSADFLRSQRGWVGWERENESAPIEIGFQFDKLRKFESVTIHVNNFVSQGAQVFSVAKLQFSQDGKKFSSHTVSFCPKRDLKNDTTVLVEIPLFGRLATYIRMELEHADEWLLLSEVSFRSEVFVGDASSMEKAKQSWNGKGYPPSTTYHYECPEHNVKNKLVNAEHSAATMIALIVGCVFVCLVLSGVSVACFLVRRNRRNTKLVGVMGMGIPPKSMSVGLGLNGCPSNEQLSGSTNVPLTQSKKPSLGSSSLASVTLTGGGKKLGKIALCDMNPVSISGETDSDESLYHELVFGRNGPSAVLAKSSGGTSKSRKSSANGGLCSYSSLAITNSSSAGSSCTSTGKTESDSGYGSSSQQLARKNGGIGGSKLLKHQKVNHGGDFNDAIGMRGLEDEMAYYHTHNQNLGHLLPSSPSTPSTGLRAAKVSLGQSLGSILHPPVSTSGRGGPPSPPQPFRIPFYPHQPIPYANSNANHNPVLHNSHLTLGPKSGSCSTGMGSNNNGFVGTVGGRERSINAGFFNSPRTNNRRSSSSNNNQPSNHPSAGVNTISAALSGPLMTLNGGVSSGTANANTLLQANSFGVSLMKSSGLSGCSNPSSNHLVGPLGICGGESNYYAATDIFQVPEKHFDRF